MYTLTVHVSRVLSPFTSLLFGPGWRYAGAGPWARPLGTTPGERSCAWVCKCTQEHKLPPSQRTTGPSPPHTVPAPPAACPGNPGARPPPLLSASVLSIPVVHSSHRQSACNPSPRCYTASTIESGPCSVYHNELLLDVKHFHIRARSTRPCFVCGHRLCACLTCTYHTQHCPQNSRTPPAKGAEPLSRTTGAQNQAALCELLRETGHPEPILGDHLGGRN